MAMAIWRKPPKRSAADIEAERLERRLRIAAERLDAFVTSLRMEIDEPGGTRDDGPVAGQ